MNTSPTGLSRRKLLAGGIGVAAGVGLGGLSGCGARGGGRVSNDSSVNSRVVLPSYIPYEGARPDLASNTDGVEAGFYRYPSDRPRSVAQRPGAGGLKVTGMANMYVPAPAGPRRNQWWAGLNNRLGIDLDMIMVPNADYTTKFATTVAGGDLPDMMQMQVVENYPRLLEKRFTVLDDFLSGDGIKDYPNLANIPTFTWKNAVYNGHLYGVPIPRGRVGGYDLIRPDIFAENKVATDITGGWEEFLESMKALTAPTRRRWSFALGSSALSMLMRMNECANGWRLDGGDLTSVYETEQYKQSVQDMITLWKAGVIHPDGFNDQQPWKELFSSGNISINPDGYQAWPVFVTSNKNNPGFEQGLMTFSTRDGSGPAPWFPGSGVYGFSTGPAINAFAKTDDVERTKVLLRVCDYLAAPFGTEEQFYINYGKEGVHHDLVDGEPVLNDRGVADIALPVQYVGAPPHVLYQPGRRRDVEVQHAYMSQVLPRSVVNPTVGLFSNTASTSLASASTAFSDAVNSIIVGRQPFSTLDDAVKRWRSMAGDAMRVEFGEQLQSAAPQPSSSAR